MTGIEIAPGLTVFLRRSPKAVRLRLRILPDGTAEAVLPRFCTEAEALAFVRQNLDWLRRMTARRPRKTEILFPRFLDLPYLGGRMAVQYAFRPVRWAGAKCVPEEKYILVSGNVLSAEAVRSAIREMLKVSTERWIFPYLEGLAAKFGFQPGQLSVRLQKGRWGSCSAHGISLNAMLLFLPEELVEYVLIHELCHLRQMNHSPQFWQEVAKYCPDWQRRRKRLRDIGITLQNW